MGRLLKRRLLEVKTAGKNIRCRKCREYIWKGSPYTFCAILGFWGGYHHSCFDKVSVNLETKDTGEFKADNSKKKAILETGKKIKELVDIKKLAEEVITKEN